MGSQPRPVRILAISGSLRASSSNTALVWAIAALAPDAATVSVYDGLGRLPPFNPDADVEPAHPAVADFRSQLQMSDAVLISTPEYAHGVPGVLKNALDWIVGSGELIDKPVAVINASPRSTHACASLIETLTVMSAKLIRDASITLALTGRPLAAGGIAADPDLAAPLRAAVLSLVAGTAGSSVGWPP